MYTKLKKVNEGFTIVETLIVLAIAALIITIILIAVPDLQRSARNSNILHDAQNIASAIQTSESNNQGALPTAITGPDTTSQVQITGANGAVDTASKQSTTTVDGFTSGTTIIKYKASVGDSSTTQYVGPGHIVVAFGFDCDSNGPGATSGSSLAPTADPRASAVYYGIEQGSGSGYVGCIQE